MYFVVNLHNRKNRLPYEAHCQYTQNQISFMWPALVFQVKSKSLDDGGFGEHIHAR